MKRALWAILLALLAGSLLYRWYGLPESNPLVVIIRTERPAAYTQLWWAWTVPLYLTSLIVISFVMSACSTLSWRMPRRRQTGGALPPLVPVEKRKELEVVLGEVHHQHKFEPSDNPQWLTLPERSLNTGVMVLGATGTGKTSAVMIPLAKQILGWAAGDDLRKVAGLVLEVKGDFCGRVKEILHECGRGDDYVALSMDRTWRYNPLHSDRSPNALAFSIATLLEQLDGKSKERFWIRAATNMLTNVIMLCRVLEDYARLDHVYHLCCSPQKLEAKIEEAERLFTAKSILITVETWLQRSAGVLDHLKFDPPDKGMMRLPWSGPVEQLLLEKEIPFVLAEVQSRYAADADRRTQLWAVAHWYYRSWTQMEPKLRTSIVETIEPFLQVFDANPDAKYIFCPPKEAYDPRANADKRYGSVLPHVRSLIESGKVLALDFNLAKEPGVSRLIGVLMKQDFQQAMLSRTEEMAREPWRTWRSALFLCDEYHQFATCGADNPDGDEKFFALSRSARCIPVVATQSISSLKSTLHDDAAWATLVQQFRTTVLLATKDKLTAEWAREMCGRQYRLQRNYSYSESGNDTRVNVFTGKPVAGKTSLTAAKSYSNQKDYVFDTRVFLELKNCQSVVLAYDGVDPLPATLCYLKPSYLPEEMPYFEQVRRKLL